MQDLAFPKIRLPAYRKTLVVPLALLEGQANDSYPGQASRATQSSSLLDDHSRHVATWFALPSFPRPYFFVQVVCWFQKGVNEP